MSKSNLSELLSSTLSSEEIDALATMVAERLREDVPLRFLNEREAARFVGLSHGSLRTMRYEGTGPAFVKLGSGPKCKVRYDSSDLIEWMRTRPRYYSTTELAKE